MNEAGDVQAVEAAGPPPGGRLAEARQAQNLTPADVARQLKLSVWQVEALESGRFEQLPGPIFVRGFIRNYARLVKIDPNELLHALGDSIPQSAPRAAVEPSPDIPFPVAGGPPWPALAAAVAVVVGLLAAYEFYWNEPEPRPVRADAAVAPAPVAQPAPAAAQAAATASSRPAPAADTQAALPSIALANALQATPDTRPVAVADPQADAEKERTPGPGERQVKLAFDQESWVEIRDRNERIIFSQLNRPGTQQSVNGMPPFSIVVGNAQGVRMTYAEKPVDLAPHTRTDVARLILQ